MRSSSLLWLALAGVCLLALAAVPAEGVLRRGESHQALQAEAEAACDDKRPKGSEQFTCAQQKEWGKCSASWMRGFCKKTCNKCGGSGSSSSGGGGGGGGSSLSALNINAPASRTAPIRAVSSTYKDRKNKILRALRATGMSEAKVKMALAIAMLETNSFDPNDRDKKKTGDSTNYSQFNINRDMLTRIGISTANLNEWAGLNKVAQALKKMIDHYGVNGFLNYLRGGYTGWKDGVSYDCAGYRNGIASIVKMFDADLSLMTDNRRVDMEVGHR